MNLAFVLQKQISSPILTDRELDYLPWKSDASRYNQVKRALKKGELIRLKRGVYCFGTDYQKKPVNSFALAQKLYWPSYVSLESALSHYHLIPEAVYTITSVTPKNATEIKTPLGNFSYTHLALKNFEIGFQRLQTQGAVFLMATPLKALCDLVCLQKRSYKKLADLAADLRLNFDELRILLQDMPNKELQSFSKIYNSTHVDDLLHILLWELL